MSKILTVVGARPQFVKAAVVSRAIREHNAHLTNHQSLITEVIVHTGQHFDDNMSKVFFDEMDIPKPDYNLNINSVTHGAMTGRMLEKIEEVLLKEKPDWVLVYGDTNSTIAGALAASKLHIPVAHVEAGLRSFNMRMPEEQNRILTDHISTKLFCPTDTAVSNLKREGVEKGVHRTGDVMYDAYLYYRTLIDNVKMDIPEKFVLVTLHRAENTDDKARLSSIVSAMNENVHRNFVFPIHPRTAKKLEDFGLRFNDNVKMIDPVGYFEMLYLEENCECVMTDSGGVQKEAYFAKKPCITLRDETEWIETVESGWNRCVGADKKEIMNALDISLAPSAYPSLYGDGRTGMTILGLMV